jgi:hypothetical protein
VPAYLYALMLHGVIGGLDVFVNHEWLARLPYRPEARSENRLHSARETIFGTLFALLAWSEWHGAAAGWIAALLAAELLVSAGDVLVEGNSRVLPQTERVLHLLLFVNLGSVIVLVGQALMAWSALPAAVVRADHGWAGWVLSTMAAGSYVWALRDARSAMRLARAPARPAQKA